MGSGFSERFIPVSVYRRSWDPAVCGAVVLLEIVWKPSELVSFLLELAVFLGLSFLLVSFTEVLFLKQGGPVEGVCRFVVGSH